MLEALEEVDTIVFDKTGTLTANQPYVSQVYAFGDHDEHDILFYAAMAEQRQSHPIALAILEGGKGQAASMGPRSKHWNINWVWV